MMICLESKANENFLTERGDVDAAVDGNAHLYIGLVCSALIHLLSVTGLLLNHRGWMVGGETVLYESPDFPVLSAHGHGHGGHGGERNDGQAGLSLPESWLPCGRALGSNPSGPAQAETKEGERASELQPASSQSPHSS